MVTNTACTLYRQLLDPATRDILWQRVALPAVMWQEELAAREAGKGREGAGAATVFIPLRGGLSIQPGDRLVRGACEGEAPPGGARVVTRAALGDFGRRALRHWEVEAR